MTTYILRRLIQTVGLLFLLSVILFTLVNVAPGGPITAYAGRRPRPERIEQLKRQFGLDQPLPLQYVYWLVGNDWTKIDSDGDGVKDEAGLRKGILRGDFGLSYRTRKSVLIEISSRLPNTIYLMSITMLVALAIAIPLGIYSAIKQYSLFDFFATTFSFAGQAIPEFWLGLLLIIIFYAWLKNPVTGEPLLPAGGISSLDGGFSLSDRLAHLVLPVLTGTLGWVAWYSRFLRSSLLEILPLNYLKAARARGLTERNVIFKHALSNALIPIVTLLALDLPYIFTGAVLVETIFAWPGMGRLYYQSAVDRDYPLLLAVLIIGAAFIILCNLIADVLYAYLDPRVRYE
ncbi:MAG TPA: ABC transporter permease [Anaerolineales bacterium]|jgi:peptide/nickel transport system permease protein|nr:ABC transporter permease [Anaerolineales bacterium]HQX17838.1 ABC transporter permease [Anaerolineales bacterium]